MRAGLSGWSWFAQDEMALGAWQRLEGQGSSAEVGYGPGGDGGGESCQGSSSA